MARRPSRQSRSPWWNCRVIALALSRKATSFDSRNSGADYEAYRRALPGWWPFNALEVQIAIRKAMLADIWEIRDKTYKGFRSASARPGGVPRAARQAGE
jgi:hypothetical protein